MEKRTLENESSGCQAHDNLALQLFELYSDEGDKRQVVNMLAKI